jgi:D-threo-aldose 1-dehydrogenase
MGLGAKGSSLSKPKDVRSKSGHRGRADTVCASDPGHAVPAGSPLLSDKTPLGRTSVIVSRFGLGCAPIGGLFAAVDDITAERTLDAAWSGGVRYFDTAPHYGTGLSEVRLGQFLSGRPRDQFAISTKVGRLLVAQGSGKEAGSSGTEFVGGLPAREIFDFGPDGIEASLESSLGRLQLDRVDIVFIHDPDDHMEEAIGGAYPTLARLRDEGVVGAIGVGMNRADLLERFVRETDIDVALIAGRHTLLDDRATRSLLPVALERQVAILVGGVFNSGILANPGDGATFDYRVADTALVTRVRQLAEIAARYQVALPAVALQWPFRDPAVTGIVVGARSQREVHSDLAWAGVAVPDALWEELTASGLLGWHGPGAVTRAVSDERSHRTERSNIKRQGPATTVADKGERSW